VPVPVPLAPATRRFLEAPGRFAVIATLGADGTPHQTVVWYALDGDDVLINSRVGRRWPSDLQRDPRISLTVDGSAGASRGEAYVEAYVTIQARAEVVATGAAAMRDIQALARRYGRPQDSWQGQERITFRLAPRAVHAYGAIDG